MPDNVRINIDIVPNGTPELQQLAAAMRVIQEQAARQEAQLQSLSQGYQKLGQSITSALDTLGKSGVLSGATKEAAQAVLGLKTVSTEITGIVTNLNGQRVKLNVDSSEFTTASTRAKQFQRDLEEAKQRAARRSPSPEVRAAQETVDLARSFQNNPKAVEAIAHAEAELEAARARAGANVDVLAVPLRKLDNSGLDAQNQKLREGIALQTGGEEALLKLRIQDLEAVRQIGLAEAKTAEAQLRVNQSVDAAIAREKDHSGLVQELKLREEIAQAETKFGALVEKTNQRELTGVQKIEAEREKNLKHIAELEARAPGYTGGAKLREQINAKADADLKEEGRFNFRGRRGLGGNVLQSALYAAQSPQYAAFSAVSGFAESLPAAGIAAGVAAIGIGVLAKSLYDVVKSAADAGLETQKFAERTGLSIKEAYDLSAASEIAGVNVLSLATAMRTLEPALTDSSTEGKKARAALFSIKAEIVDMNGQIKPTGAILQEIATKLAAIPEFANRQTAAQDILSRSARELTPELLHLADNIRKVQGLDLISEKQTDQLAKTAEKINELGVFWKRLQQEFVAHVVGQIDLVFPDALNPGSNAFKKELQKELGTRGATPAGNNNTDSHQPFVSVNRFGERSSNPNFTQDQEKQTNANIITEANQHLQDEEKLKKPFEDLQKQRDTLTKLLATPLNVAQKNTLTQGRDALDEQLKAKRGEYEGAEREAEATKRIIARITAKLTPKATAATTGLSLADQIEKSRSLPLLKGVLKEAENTKEGLQKAVTEAESKVTSLTTKVEEHVGAGGINTEPAKQEATELRAARVTLKQAQERLKAFEGGPRQLGEFERRIFDQEQQAFRLKYPASRFGALPEVIGKEQVFERDVRTADKISAADKQTLINRQKQRVYQPEIQTAAEQLAGRIAEKNFRLDEIKDRGNLDVLQRRFDLEERLAKLESSPEDAVRSAELITQAHEHQLEISQKLYAADLKRAEQLKKEDPAQYATAVAEATRNQQERTGKADVEQISAAAELRKRTDDQAKKDAEELAHIRNETELHGFQLQIEHAAHIAELTRDRESPVTALERAFETEKKLAQLAFDFETRENAVTFRDDPGQRKIADEKARQRLIEDGQRSEYEREEKLAALRKQERDSSKAAAASLYDAIRGGSKGLHDFFKAQADKIGQNAFAALIGPVLGNVSKSIDPTGQGFIHDIIQGTIGGGSLGTPRQRPDEIGPVAAIPPGQELPHHSGFHNFLAALTTGIPERPTAPLITPSADVQAGVLAHPELLAAQQSQTISDEALQASIKQLAEPGAAKLAGPTSEISALIPHLDPVRSSLDSLRGSIDGLNATIGDASTAQAGAGTTPDTAADTQPPVLTELGASSLVHSSKNAVTAANKLAQTRHHPITANVDTDAITDAFALGQPETPLVAPEVEKTGTETPSFSPHFAPIIQVPVPSVHVEVAPAQPSIQTSTAAPANLQALHNANALRQAAIPPQIASGLQYVGIPAAQESVKAQAPQQTAALLPPALPTLPSPLAISTPPSIPGLKGRYSPLGVAEYIVPPTLRNQYLPTDSDAITSPAEGTQKPRTLYAADLDTPEIRTHERIHQAQDQLTAPKPYQIAKAIAPIFGGDEKKANEYIRRVGLTDVDDKSILNSSEARKQGAAEAPAYLFQAPPAVNSDKQYLEGLEPQAGLEGYQNAYNNYVNLLKALNPGKPVGIEQVAPPEFQQNYLKTQASTFETLPPQSSTVSPHGFETLGELASSDITNLHGLFAGPAVGTPVPRESFPVKPPSLGLHITGPLPAPAPLEPNTLQRLATSANPLPAIQGTIQEYINRPAEIRKQFDALGAFQEQDKSGKPFTAAQKARIEAAMNAQLPNAEGNLLAEQLAPVVKAGEQIGKGDLAGASGTVIGSAAPFLIGKGLGFAVGSVPEVAAGLKTLQEHPLAQALLDEEGGIGPRAERALSTYKPSTQAKQALADQSEAQLSKALRIPRTTGNAPFDLQNDQVGIEVKTLLDNGNDKITMHPESLERKRIAAEQAGITPYTVAVDKRGIRPEYYLREGLGSFRIGAMDKVPSLAALRRHLFDETGSFGPGSGRTKTFQQWLAARHPLPAQGKIPETGTVPYIKADDGSIYAASEYMVAHLQLAEQLGIHPSRIAEGGFLSEGVESSSSSTSANIAALRDSALAKERLTFRREQKGVTTTTSDFTKPAADSDYWGKQIASIVRDPRNITKQEWKTLDPIYEHFSDQQDWSNAQKSAEAIATTRGDIINGPGVGHSRRVERFDPAAFFQHNKELTQPAELLPEPLPETTLAPAEPELSVGERVARKATSAIARNQAKRRAEQEAYQAALTRQQKIRATLLDETGSFGPGSGRRSEPTGLYHGTNAEFAQFDPKFLDISTKHGSSGLGFFFSPEKRVAQAYGKNIIAAQLDIRNPYSLSKDEYAALETPLQARTFKADLEKRGFDGIKYEYGNEVAAFRPDQINRVNPTSGLDTSVNLSREAVTSIGRTDPVIAALALGTKPEEYFGRGSTKGERMTFEQFASALNIRTNEPVATVRAEVPFDRIHADPAALDRAAERSQSFIAAYGNGAQFPPITVVPNAHGQYALDDGFHRYSALKTNPPEIAPVDLKFDPETSYELRNPRNTKAVYDRFIAHNSVYAQAPPAITRTDPVIAALATNTDATKSLTDAILNVTPGGGIGPNPLAQNPLPAAAIAPTWPGAATGAGADITGNIAGDITGGSFPELPGSSAPYTPTIVLPPSTADLTPTPAGPAAAATHTAATKTSPIAATQSALHELSRFSSAVHGPAGQAFGAAGSVGSILQNIQDLRGALAARKARQYEQEYHRLPIPGHAEDLTLPNLDLPTQQAGISPSGFATLPQQFASIGDIANQSGILSSGNSYNDQSYGPATAGLAGQFGGLPGAPAFQESYQSPALGTLGSASAPLPSAPPYTLTGTEGPASVSAAGVPTYTALATTTAPPEGVGAPALSAIPTALDQQITTAYPSINAGSTGVLPQNVLDAAGPFNNPFAALKTLNTGLQDLSAGFGAGGLGSSSSSGSSLLSTPISRLFGLGDIPKDKKGSPQQIGDIATTGATVTAGALAAISGFKHGGARGDLQGIGSILGTAAALDYEPISKAVLGIAAGITAMISAFLPDPRAQREKQLTQELFKQKIAAEPFVQPGINVEESATGRAIGTDFLGNPTALNARPLVYTIREGIGFQPLHGDRVVTAPVRQVGIGPLGGFANPLATQSPLVSITPPNLPLGSRDINPLVMSGNGPSNTFRSGTQQDTARQDGPQQQAPPFSVVFNNSWVNHNMDSQDIMRRGPDIANALVDQLRSTHRISQQIRDTVSQT